MSERVIMVRRTLARLRPANKPIGAGDLACLRLPGVTAVQNRAFLPDDPGSQWCHGFLRTDFHPRRPFQRGMGGPVFELSWLVESRAGQERAVRHCFDGLI